MILALITILLSLSLTTSLLVVPKCASNKHAQPAILLFAGGAGLGPEAYTPVFDKIHTSACSLGLRVWIGSPKFFADNWFTQGQFDNAIRASLVEVERSMLSHGVMDLQNVRVFYGGHSRGGVSIQDLVKSLPPPSSDKGTSRGLLMQAGQGALADDILHRYHNGGLILFSSAIQRKYRPDNNGIFVSNDYPVLTVGGELDGLFRLFRLAEAFYHSRNSKPDDQVKRIVAVIPGANHMSFASGPTPFFVKLNDLKSEMSEEEAHTFISDLVYSFIIMNSSPDSDSSNMAVVAKTVLQNAHDISKPYFEPIIKALEYEGSYHLKPACNEIPAGDTRDCWKGSKWSERAQVLMAKLPQSEITVEDAFWKVWLFNPVHLPDIKNNCTSPIGCKLSITTVSQCTYSLIDPIDSGFNAVACEELRVKMKSRQKSHIAAGIKNASFKDLDDNNEICRDINEIALEWARDNADPKVYNRYLQHGSQLMNGEDLGPYNAGPTWIWKDLSYKKLETGDVVELRSPTMRTPADYFIPLSSGFHYCKLLSPARALEWIYTDSLKAANYK